MAYLASKMRPGELDDENPGAPVPVSTAPAPSAPAPSAAPIPQAVSSGLTPASGSNFPDLTAYLRGNREAFAAMGQKASEGLAGQADKAVTDVQGGNYDGISDIQAKIDNSGSEAGRQGLITDAYGAAPTPGGGRLDAYGVGQVGSGPLDDLRAKYGDLLASVRPVEENLPAPVTKPVEDVPPPANKPKPKPPRFSVGY